jgi:hypothetical protein
LRNDDCGKNEAVRTVGVVHSLISDEKKLGTNTRCEKHKDYGVVFEDVEQNQNGYICHTQVLEINSKQASLKVRA